LQHSGEYRAVVTDDIATIFSDVATLEVRMRPIIVEQPASQTLIVGSTLTLSIRVQASTPVGYRWRRSGFNVTNIVLNDTNCTLVIPNAQTNHSGSYAVIVTNAAYVTPGVQSSLAIVNIMEPPSVIAQPTSQTAAAGGNVLFSVRAGGSAPFGYQWRFNGANISGATSTNLALTNVQPAQTGGYSVVITNAVGSITSVVATLTVTGSADSDGDGMPDDWETLYSFNINNPADALQDADGDLMTNLQEYNAGTNPRDPLSYLRLRLIRSGGSSLTFNAVADRTYTIEYRDTLSPGSWQVLQNVPAGPTREVQLNDAAGGSTRFYRLRTP
jgi:hypothetical protein